MAALPIADRTRILRGLMRRWSTDHVSCALTKPQIYDPQSDTGAIAEVDNWIDGRQGLTAPDTVGFNGALNTTVRALLTGDQKTDIFLAVAAMRRGIDYLKTVFGEVD